MKKITLLLLMCFSTFLGSAQVALTEGFEGTTVPASGSWALGSGSWAVFDNGVGIVNTWAANNVASEGTRCAYMNGAQDNITAGNSAQDWLVTPAVTVPTNGQLRFFTRQSLAAESGTIYQIRVSSTSQTNTSSFTVLQEWNETTLNAQFNVYEEKVIPLNLPAGSTVYVAFVMLKNGPGAGDRWHVDAVKVVEECVAPTSLSAIGVTQTGANLTWLNPGGATSWEVEIIPGTTTTPSGHGVVYNGNSPYTATGTATGSPLVQAPFAASTEYKYYVRALCTGSGTSSAWVGPFTFTTGVPGFTCSSAISVTGLPYSTTDDTANYGDLTDVNQGPAAGCGGGTTNYMTGNDVFYSYTPTVNEVISVTMTPTANWAGVFVYNGCTNVGVSCIAGVGNSAGANIPRVIPAVALTAGQTYIFAISTNAAPQTTPYTLVIQKVNCTPPTALAASNATTTSAALSWGNPGNLASSWEVKVQTSGTGIPTGAGTTTTNNTAYPAGGLNPSTAYEFYVRANCGDGTFSSWTGPYVFNTQCASFNVPFQEGFNSTSPTQFCWTVLNLNGDTDLWNMDYATTPFEGNQSAMLYTDGNAGNNNDWLVSPTINVTGNQRLKYHYRVQSAGEPDAFEVKLSTTGVGEANFTTTLVPLATYNNITYVEKIVNLTGVTGAINIAWHVPQGGPDGWRVYIDNVIVEDIPTCPTPSALAAAPTTTGAQLSWTVGNVETQWQVVVQAPGAGVPAATAGGNPVGNPFTTTTPLTPATTYEYYVRAYCAANDVSQWVGPFSFTTLCTAFNVPFQEGFNSTSPTQTCWTVLNLNGDTDAWNMDYATNPFEGNQSANIYTDFNGGNNNDWLISPTINLTGNQRLKYHYRVESAGEPDAFEVKLSTTGVAEANFTQTVVALATYNNITYVEKIVNLTGITGPVNIGWHIPQGGPDGWRVYIDNVIVEDIPSCPDPTALAAAPTTTGAQLSWLAGNTETQWQVVVQAPGTGVPAATAGGTPVGNPFTTTTPLTPATTYEYYVRAYCAANDQSQWVGPFIFTTLCNPFTAPFYEGFNSDSPTESCWTVLNLNGDTDAWNMNYATTPFEGNQSAMMYTDGNNGNNNDWLISPTIIIGANQRIKFHYRVQSTGEPNDFEVLMSTTGIAPASFTQQIVPLQSYNNIVYEQSITNLTGVTGPVNFAWHVPNGGLDGWRIYIDNVIIEDIPPCPEPLNINVTCVSSQGANVSWTQGGTETSWEVAVVPSGDPIPTSGELVTPDPLYYAQGLTPETAYNFYVRAVCPGMGSGFGAWVMEGFTTPTTSVSDAQPFCASAGQSILFQNTDDSMNVTEYGQVACLGSTPNPVWYYLQVDTAGNLDFQLIQNTSFDENGNPTGNALDVDFAAFGPFTSLNEACGEIVLQDCPTCPNNTGNSTFYPFGNIVDCSYSAAAIENFTIPNAQPGEIYAVLITNYNGDAGQILLEQLSSSTATTNCNILYNVDLGGDQNLCGVSQTTITATVATPGNSEAPSYAWFMDGAPITPTIVGNTALSQTIEVSTAGSHVYSVVITVANSANTEPITDSVTIVLGPAVTATAPQEYAVCDDASNDGFATFDLTTLNSQVLGTLDATQYTVSYFLTEADADANTAAITSSATFINTVADTQTIYIKVASNLVNACFDVVPAVLTVKDLPVTTLDPSYTICQGNQVTITGVNTNYAITDATYVWSLNGTPISGETTISYVATQAGTYTLEVTLNGCTNSVQTTVIVNQLPQFTLTSDFTLCTGNSATLTVTPGNFNAADVTFIWTLDGTTTLPDTGSTITVTQGGTYEVTVGTSGCTTSDSVIVNEVASPTADAPIDQIACEGYTLPALSAGNNYFTGTGGTGTQLAAGTVIDATQPIYVYASLGTNCTDENSFMVTILDKPAVSVTGSCQGSEYIIEADIVDENLSEDNFDFVWTDASGNVVGGNSPTVTVTVSGTYFVNVSATGSTVVCSTDAQFDANGTTCNIQKGISPNGDGKNDSFDLSGLQVRKITIFNRYGTIVYDRSNYTNEWFGQTNKGDDLPDGTYFYSFEREGGESKTGWIYINRQRN